MGDVTLLHYFTFFMRLVIPVLFLAMMNQNIYCKKVRSGHLVYFISILYIFAQTNNVFSWWTFIVATEIKETKLPTDQLCVVGCFIFIT